MSEETLEMAKFLMSLPDNNPLADLENMQRNLSRALNCCENGEVRLTEAEIRYWILGINELINQCKMVAVPVEK